MSTAARGLDATISIGTSAGTLTAIGLLTGTDFDLTKPVTEFVPMGSLETQQVLQGVKKYKGAYRKAFVDWTYVGYLTGGSVLVGSMVPRSGKSVVGSLVITGGRLTNMETENEAAVIEEGNFVMYLVSFA